MRINILIWGLIFSTFLSCKSIQPKKTLNADVRIVAFYNLENLFDTLDDPTKYDNDFMPKGKYHWTEEQYRKKLSNMAKVISLIGKKESQKYPDIIGVAEIENERALTDLLKTPPLSLEDYGFIHRESPDRRGIDVALIYKKSAFTPLNFGARRLYLKNKKKRPIYTRDQLVVTGSLKGENFCFIVNHWPSRYGGLKRSKPLREKAALLNKAIFDSLRKNLPNAKIISMGDFNDNPDDTTFKGILKTLPVGEEISRESFYNPMENLYNKGHWTLVYRNKGFLFDQIFFEGTLLGKKYTSYKYLKAHIFDEDFLIISQGKNKGSPKRSFVNNNFTGGYSDHLPVYIELVRRKRGYKEKNN